MTRSTNRSMTRSTLARAAAAAFDFDVVTDTPPRRRPAVPESKDSAPDPKAARPAPAGETAG